MIRTTMKKVEEILQFCPEARNSDRLLVEIYMKVHHGIREFHDYRKATDAPSLETITRCRRKLQSLGLYKASEEIADGRREEEADHVRYFG